MKIGSIVVTLVLTMLVITEMLATAHAQTAAGQAIVEDGRARAEILIAEDPPRMLQLAAEELQTHLERISGARLVVVTEPSDDVPLRIYVGRSAHTDALGIDDEGLKYGAFRMRTVADGLVLLGYDADFEPVEPYTLNARADAELYAKWDEITGDTFGNPRGVLYRRYNRDMGIFTFDKRGSLNAVYEFLRGLGVRWYMPGELGTIIPTSQTILLPEEDRVVHPEFDWRMSMFAIYFSSPREDILWYLRQGFNHGDVVGHWSHGLRDVTSRPEMKENHPERYALVRGVRQTDTDLGHGNQPCLSSEELFEAAVRFGRAMYDVYDLPMVSVMPQDGFMFCECGLCEGKDTPQRGREGQHSDYVWGFVDRVARELYKTHPDRGVNCLAYGTYQLPPENIDQLSPNVYVGIIHSRGRHFDDPESRERIETLQASWRELTDQPFWNWEHYPFTHRSTFTPYYYPRSIAEGIRSIREEYFGEFIEAPIGPFEERGHGLHTPGFSHLNLYVTGRFQWDADQDVEALLAEYCRLFYGPAADEMQAFIDYCEANRRHLQTDIEIINKALELLEAARESASPETKYGQRIELVSDYLDTLREWRDQLARGRENVPTTEAPVRTGSELNLDGQLVDAVWQDLPTHPLVDVQTGEEAQVGSWFKMYWEGGEREGHLVIGIHCDEPDMASMRTLTEESGDWRVFDGDNIELLLETQSHSYYQIAINAAGAVVDLDRNLGQRNADWTSLSEVAVHHGEDYWSIEVRVPVTGEQTPGDPLHELAGWRPSAEEPWHINVCRQRLRGEDREWTAWSATGSNFHDIMRFGRVE